MKLYVFPPSPNARKVQMVTHHLGLEPEIEIVDLGAGDQHSPAYLAINPNGVMPALQDGDLTLWESNAIMQYLCSKSESQTLWPSDPAAQADVSRWQCWQLTCFGPACGTLVFQNMVKAFFGDDSGPDPDKVAEGTEQFHKYATVLNDHLRGREWIVGTGVTLADLSLASFLGFAGPARIPVAEYDEINRWMESVGALEAWQATEPQMPTG